MAAKVFISPFSIKGLCDAALAAGLITALPGERLSLVEIQ